MENNDYVDLIRDGLERVSEAAHFLGVSRSHLYRLMGSGVLPFVKIGRTRRVPIRAVRGLACRNLNFDRDVPDGGATGVNKD